MHLSDDMLKIVVWIAQKQEKKRWTHILEILSWNREEIKIRLHQRVYFCFIAHEPQLHFKYFHSKN